MIDKPAGPAAAEAVAIPLDSDQLTAFDRDHLVVYLRVLDAITSRALTGRSSPAM